MSVRWHTYPDAAAAAEACSHHVLGLLEETLAGQDAAAMALSGGSTPKLLFEQMARAKFNWGRVHLFWVDERAVPPADPASNYKLAEDTLIKPLHIPRAQVHRIHGELAPERAAEQYAADIAEFFALEDGALPHFDVVLQGMGPDAHTASLFPGEPLIDDRRGIAAAVHTPKPPPWRVTLLPGVLLAAKHTVFLVAGADKAEPVRAVFEDEYDPMRLPAQMVTHHGRRVAWFMDKAAAHLVEEE
ncbi:MAG: 6-phosphogluconolactonase [Bryobacteraceae bacterium]